MSEEDVMVTEKKSCLLGCLFRLAVFAATVYGALTAAKKVMVRLTRRLEEDNEGNAEKRYLVGLGTREIRVKDEEISDVDVTVVGGCTELDLSEAQLAEEVFVKIRVLGGKVVVKVPAMVRVDLSGKGVVCGFSNMVPTYEDEKLPIIHVDADSAGACLKVVLGEAF